MTNILTTIIGIIAVAILGVATLISTFNKPEVVEPQIIEKQLGAVSVSALQFKTFIDTFQSDFRTKNGTYFRGGRVCEGDNIPDINNPVIVNYPQDWKDMESDLGITLPKKLGYCPWVSFSTAPDGTITSFMEIKYNDGDVHHTIIIEDGVELFHHINTPKATTT